MKRLPLTLFLVLLGAFSSFIMAQDDAAAQKAWMDYMTPSTVHQMIAKSDGEWASEMTMWTAPNSQPNKSTGTTVNKMILE